MKNLPIHTEDSGFATEGWGGSLGVGAEIDLNKESAEQ